MNRAQPLFRSSLVRVDRFDHPAGRAHRDPDEEIATSHTISLVTRGAFHVLRGRRKWRLTPSTLFVTHPGFTYRCAHEGPEPGDVCLSATLAPAFAGEVEAATGRPWGGRVPVAPMTNRLAYLGHRLERALESDPEPVAIETLVGDLAAGLADGSGAARLFGEHQLGWYAERVDAARGILQERFAEPHTLRSLSREVGMSPFHFARIFRELAGVPPHRYLIRIRLARACGMLRSGAGVTQTCLATGFNNLGHFIRLFHRTFGVPPSRHCG
ncbi:MAG TPA: AraC family transcriptional regulator [Candidatus Polarisedimenticolia bacterium]|jgi:AraC-like DNA-binding protein